MKKTTGWFVGLTTLSLFSFVLLQIQDSNTSSKNVLLDASNTLVKVTPDNQSNTDVNSENIGILSIQLEQLGIKLSLLSEQMEGLSRQSSSSVLSESTASQGMSSDVRDSINASNASKEYQAQLEIQQQMQALDNNFQAQDIDPSWSQATESRILDAFNNPELASSHGIQNIECRGSLCKIDVVSQLEDGGAGAGGFHTKLREQISDILPVGAMQPNGSGGVTVYLAKSPDDMNMR